MSLDWRAPSQPPPLIVGLGGTPNAESSTERALVQALKEVSALGARTELIGGCELARLPHYLTAQAGGCPAGLRLIDSMRNADGIIIASPAYHGSISGLIKNALDYLEDTSGDARPYLDGLPVGLIVTAHGWQATGSTLAALRSVAHALRGWPTPFGATINSRQGAFRPDGTLDETVLKQLKVVASQVCDLAWARHLRRHMTGEVPA